jgi:hypothetical protein
MNPEPTQAAAREQLYRYFRRTLRALPAGSVLALRTTSVFLSGRVWTDS